MSMGEQRERKQVTVTAFNGKVILFSRKKGRLLWLLMHVSYEERSNDVTTPSTADSVTMVTIADDVITHLWWHTHGP